MRRPNKGMEQTNGALAEWEAPFAGGGDIAFYVGDG